MLNSNKQKSINDYSKFPVILSDYDPNWAMVYDHEKEKILNTVGFLVDQIFHFGSTSIPGMIAKPTVDILVNVKELIPHYKIQLLIGIYILRRRSYQVHFCTMF